MIKTILIDRSHALRGNAALDALRPVLGRLGFVLKDAERLGMRYHAERGNDKFLWIQLLKFRFSQIAKVGAD